jgi:hypothetical protein
MTPIYMIFNWVYELKKEPRSRSFLDSCAKNIT